MNNTFKSTNWIEYEIEDGYYSKWPIDHTFGKRHFKIGNISLWVRIRVVQYYEDSDPLCRTYLIYNRTFIFRHIIRYDSIELNAKRPDYPSGTTKSQKFILNILNYFLGSNLFYEDARNNKFIRKYKFIQNIFPEIIRENKLKELLK